MDYLNNPVYLLMRLGNLDDLFFENAVIYCQESFNKYLGHFKAFLWKKWEN